MCGCPSYAVPRLSRGLTLEVGQICRRVCAGRAVRATRCYLTLSGYAAQQNGCLPASLPPSLAASRPLPKVGAAPLPWQRRARSDLVRSLAIFPAPSYPYYSVVYFRVSPPSRPVSYSTLALSVRARCSRRAARQPVAAAYCSRPATTRRQLIARLSSSYSEYFASAN